MIDQDQKIAFQGMQGAYSDMACRSVYKNIETLPCHSFEDAFLAVQNEQAALAMIPVDNTIAGRVADVHHLLPGGELFIIGEHFQKIQHNLLGIKGSTIQDLKHVHSHIHALPQCKKIIQKYNLQSHVHADTAGAAEEISCMQKPDHGAIASSLAAEIYDLDILEADVQDAAHNTTRFLILAPEPEIPEISENQSVITSLTFEVRNIPASLYKCMGGFATNGFNMTKLESYVDENFQAAQFYCEVEGHPDHPSFQLALEELGFYALNVKFLGTYLAHPLRQTTKSEYA